MAIRYFDAGDIGQSQPRPSSPKPCGLLKWERFTFEAPHETTLSGHLIEHLGRVPHPGETVELDGARLEVLAGDDTQISQVAVRSAPRPPRSTE